MDMDYNKYKHPKEIPIHFFGETMLKNNDLTERYQFIGFLIFRMLARRKERAGPFKIENTTKNSRLYIRLYFDENVIYELHEDFYGEYVAKASGTENDFCEFVKSYIVSYVNTNLQEDQIC